MGRDARVTIAAVLTEDFEPSQPGPTHMISVRPPDPERISEIVKAVANNPFSYPEVGVVHLVGLWWINVSRVIYTLEETDRFAFAYGTLGYHAETGEERFQVQRDPDSGDVTYSILAFSRPRHILARLGYPLSRAAQRLFAVIAYTKIAESASTKEPGDCHALSKRSRDRSRQHLTRRLFDGRCPFTRSIWCLRYSKGWGTLRPDDF